MMLLMTGTEGGIRSYLEGKLLEKLCCSLGLARIGYWRGRNARLQAVASLRGWCTSRKTNIGWTTLSSPLVPPCLFLIQHRHHSYRDLLPPASFFSIIWRAALTSISMILCITCTKRWPNSPRLSHLLDFNAKRIK